MPSPVSSLKVAGDDDDGEVESAPSVTEGPLSLDDDDNEHNTSGAWCRNYPIESLERPRTVAAFVVGHWQDPTKKRSVL